MIDYIDAIPGDWFVDHDGQALVLDSETVGRLVMAAKSVIELWPTASIIHHPMIDELVRLREALAPRQS